MEGNAEMASVSASPVQQRGTRTEDLINGGITQDHHCACILKHQQHVCERVNAVFLALQSSFLDVEDEPHFWPVPKISRFLLFPPDETSELSSEKQRLLL